MTVDDHPIFRDGLAALLSFYKDFELVAEAADGAQAVQLFRAHRPDVTLMDLSMPVMGGAQATEAITSEFPDARIIALTTYEGDADIHRALEAGARGYLLKDALRNQIADAIRAVHRGGRVVPPTVAQKLAEYTPRIELTDRELEVLSLMAKGQSNKEIAARLNLSLHTVETHRARIMEKLDVHTTAELVLSAVRRGLVT